MINTNEEQYEIISTEEIDPLPEEIFSLNIAVPRAKRILSEIIKDNMHITFLFDDDFWVFEDHLHVGVKIYVYFSELDRFKFTKELPSNFKLMVKCWIAELLSQVNPTAAKSAYTNLLKALDWSNAFEKNKVKFFIHNFKNLMVSDQTKITFIRNIINFIIYTDLAINENYTTELYNLNSKLKQITQVRKLPPSKEVLKFAYYLDEYYKHLVLDTTPLGEKLLFLPIVIWWKLTTIIPIRASEFCLIERDCLIKEHNKFKIKLPRIKEEHNPKRLQIIDTIEISDELFYLITNYIKLTDDFGHSENLISYRSLLSSEKNHYRYLKVEHSYFHRGILDQLLKRFYKEVIGVKYKTPILGENWLTPNLTRHIAFSSLMMQGISPIEIARLGGHKTITAQYHYSFHTEYWIDSEVFNLMKKYKKIYLNSESKNTNVPYISDEIKLKAYIHSSTEFNEKEFYKLKIGYCSDKEQRCQTEECVYGCSYWRVSPQELLSKESLVSDLIAKKRSNIHELQAFIENLNKQILSDEITRRNPNTYNLLKANANHLQEEINELARVEILKFEGSIQNG